MSVAKNKNLLDISEISEIKNLFQTVYGNELFKKRFEPLKDDELIQRAVNLRHGVPFATPVFDGAKEIDINVPLVVRLAGTNFKEGKKILDKSNLKILSASDLNDAAKKIVEAIN